MKKFFYSFSLLCQKIFYRPDTRIFTIVGDLLSLAIVISILSIIFESVSGLSKYHQLFLGIEYVAVFIFSIEYICRIVGSPKKLSYIFSFFGFIDLISILPTWFHLANFTPLKSIRALRILRFLRTVRLIKVARLEHLEKRSQTDALAVIRLNLEIYTIAFILAVTILGNLAYIFEHNQPSFSNIPISMLWVLEAVLGGSISTTIPQTYAGIIIFMIARFISFILLGFLIHIVGGFLSHFLLGVKKNTRSIDGES